MFCPLVVRTCLRQISCMKLTKINLKVKLQQVPPALLSDQRILSVLRKNGEFSSSYNGTKNRGSFPPRVSPTATAQSKKVHHTVQHKLLLNSVGRFLRKRHVRFLTKTSDVYLDLSRKRMQRIPLRHY
jgi:hypothetical protein